MHQRISLLALFSTADAPHFGSRRFLQALRFVVASAPALLQGKGVRHDICLYLSCLAPGRGAAQGTEPTLGSARTWGNAQPASSQKISQYSQGRARSPAFLLFLSSIYVFFLLLVHSRAEQLWISLSFFSFSFFFSPLLAGLLPESCRAKVLSIGIYFSNEPSCMQTACN